MAEEKEGEFPLANEQGCFFVMPNMFIAEPEQEV